MNRARCKSWRFLPLLSLMLALPACASEQSRSEARIDRLLDDACPHWAMGVIAPGSMEAWVEDASVKDDRGRWAGVFNGMAGDMAQTEGWPPLNRFGNSTGPQFGSVGAPMEVSITWQSLAEPQTYTWHFVVPESMRQAMAKEEPVEWLGKSSMGCRSNIILGVAPGGFTAVWIGGNGTHTTEMLRGKAEIEPLGPDRGQHEGRYVRISEDAKAYVETHGIPYASWALPPGYKPTVSVDDMPAPPPIDIAAHPDGTYVLNDVMEVGSTLQLQADGTFQGAIEIGSAYGKASGRWTLKGNTITLSTRRTSGARDLASMFDHMQLTIDGSCLRTGLIGTNACYLRQ